MCPNQRLVQRTSLLWCLLESRTVDGGVPGSTVDPRYRVSLRPGRQGPRRDVDENHYVLNRPGQEQEGLGRVGTGYNDPNPRTSSGPWRTSGPVEGRVLRGDVSTRPRRLGGFSLFLSLVEQTGGSDPTVPVTLGF